MFHSRGAFQSKISVPVGISVRSRGISSPTMPRVSRTPAPVRLRQMGYRRSISWCISRPASVNDDLGDRCYETPAPVADVAHLLGDLVLQVPGEQEQVVGLGLGHV